NLTPPDSLLASDSAHLEGEIFKHLPGEFSEATISGTLTSYEGIFQNTLKSLGDTYLGNTIIAGNFSVDGTLSLTGDSLSTLGTLYLQNGPLAGNIDLFNGLVIIDTKGKVTAQTVTTKKLEIDNSDILSASLGSAKISAYNLAVTISTTAITQNSKIFLTPTSPTGGQSLIVSKKNPGAGFVVSLDKAYSKDITFDWFIVGGTN
ncbi:MAG: hypothetical protein Q7S44_04065, partial [bacterium]|nr:hypothetical protein [bacterium]